MPSSWAMLDKAKAARNHRGKAMPSAMLMFEHALINSGFEKG